MYSYSDIASFYSWGTSLSRVCDTKRDRSNTLYVAGRKRNGPRSSPRSVRRHCTDDRRKMSTGDLFDMYMVKLYGGCGLRRTCVGSVYTAIDYRSRCSSPFSTSVELGEFDHVCCSVVTHDECLTTSRKYWSSCVDTNARNPRKLWKSISLVLARKRNASVQPSSHVTADQFA